MTYTDEQIADFLKDSDGDALREIVAQLLATNKELALRVPAAPVVNIPEIKLPVAAPSAPGAAKPPESWNFKVVRDKDGRMESVQASQWKG